MDNNKNKTEVNPSSKQDGATPSDTPQVQRDEKGRILPGSKLNPEGNGGFADNPENRSDGSWTKAATPRAKLEKMLEDMTVADIMLAKTEFNKDTNLTAKIGDIAASGRLLNVFDVHDTTGAMTVNSKEFDSLMYMVYGSKSEVDANIHDEGGVPLIRGFVLPIAPEDFIDKDIREQLAAQKAQD
jgi:hypothetical protein